MTELSPMEQNVYSYIESMIENEGYAPSVRDICRALGIRSTSTAHACLSRLDQKGYIKKDQGKSRASSRTRQVFRRRADAACAAARPRDGGHTDSCG